MYRQLAFKVAQMFSSRYGIPVDDLVQEGVICLRRARMKYEARGGCDFDRYARICLWNRFENIRKWEWESLTPGEEATIENLWYKPDYDKQLASMYCLDEAEKVLNVHERRLWDMYKALDAERGSIASIAAFNGKTRAWASARLISIRKKLKKACERQLHKK